MLKINRVSIGSAFRVGAVTTAMIWIIISLLTLILPEPDTYYYANNMSQSPEIIDLVCGLPIAVIIGGIIGALYAFMYNLAAGWVGGIEIEVSKVEIHEYNPYNPPKAKNDVQDPHIDGDRQL